MKWVVSGASGLVGKALSEHARAEGIDVAPVRRTQPAAVHWDVLANTIAGEGLQSADAFVHLAGESVFGRWTADKRRKILDSRVQGTRAAVEACRRAGIQTLVSASAIGFYGDCGDDVLSEDSPKGTGFLADVCAAWEDEALRAEQSGIRTVIVRVGLVVSKDGGFLQKMLLPFRMGVGGKLGSGRQFMSLVGINDLVSILAAAATNPAMSGRYNATSPEPLRNADFSEQLAAALGTKSRFPVPAALAKLALGEAFVEEGLVASQRVIPKRLLESGFVFQTANANEMIRRALT